MYGYFDYKKSYLKDDERRVFAGYYCRLCYCFWNKGGQRARFLTTYDATLFNLILAIAGLDECPPSFPCQRFKTTNKKRFKDDKVGSLIADLSVIAFAVKVKDDETDGDRKRAFVANLLFKRLIKKTVASHKELYEKSYASIIEMDKLQSGNAPIEEVLALYGKIMADSFNYIFGLDEKYLRVFDALAQWSFLIDMIDDYDDDFKNHAVNSLRRDDCPTIMRLFQKRFYEFIPIVQNVSNNLRQAVGNIECEKLEWVVLAKILQHSLATLVPDILNGKNVKYNYFRDMFSSCESTGEIRKLNKKYEKFTVHN